MELLSVVHIMRETEKAGKLSGTISKIYVVTRRRASYVDENGSLTRYITFIMTIKE